MAKDMESQEEVDGEKAIYSIINQAVFEGAPRQPALTSDEADVDLWGPVKGAMMGSMSKGTGTAGWTRERIENRIKYRIRCRR